MSVRILTGDCRTILPTLPEKSVQCVVTSPPYWGLRDYGVEGQIGSEATVEEWVDVMVEVFRGVWRVLRDDGTLWLNLGDAYNAGTASKRMPTHTGKHGYWENPAIDQRVNVAGLKTKDLIGMPWMVAFALRADGWYLRSDCIWSKPNPMPESVRDRPTSAHEHMFLLTKRPRYFYDADAVRQPNTEGTIARHGAGPESPNGDKRSVGIPGQNPHHGVLNVNGHPNRANGANLRNVWTIATHPFPDAHFATFPPALVEPCIKAGTSEKGCCSSCGAPWVRLVEREPADMTSRYERGEPQRHGTNGAAASGASNVGAFSGKAEAKGWAPTCTCDADIVPCTVLDIFGGSGTTGMVADRLGRDAWLIELNPEYVSIGANRLTNDAPLFASVEVA